MTFAPPPPVAAWRHRGARVGFEVVFFRPDGDGWSIEGHSTAVEATAWAVDYEIRLDSAWCTRKARVSSRTAEALTVTTLTTDGSGSWCLDGERAPWLDGCLDVDLEASACTNVLPMRRRRLEVGAGSAVPAAYVRAHGGRVERLEQSYVRLPDEQGAARFTYSAPVFDFSCELTYDASALVLDYPGIAVRVDVQRPSS